MTGRLLLLIGCITLAAAACGGADGDDDPPEPRSPIQGLLTSVTASDSDEIIGVTLDDGDANVYSFQVELEPGAGFPATHAQEHVDGKLPVLLYFRGGGNDRLAYRIDDAP